MAEVNLARVAKALEDPAYVAVGFGVLGFQRGQVYRRALERRLSRWAGTANQSVSAVTEDVVGRLPSEAKDLLQAAGEFAHDLPQEAGDLLNEAVALGRFALKVLQAPADRRTYP
jgi:hypothetical protein